MSEYSDKRSERLVLFYSFLSVAFIVFGCIFWVVFSAQMEAQTYNKLTGSNVTWFDALWVELRIIK